MEGVALDMVIREAHFGRFTFKDIKRKLERVQHVQGLIDPVPSWCLYLLEFGFWAWTVSPAPASVPEFLPLPHCVGVLQPSPALPSHPLPSTYRITKQASRTPPPLPSMYPAIQVPSTGDICQLGKSLMEDFSLHFLVLLARFTRAHLSSPTESSISPFHRTSSSHVLAPVGSRDEQKPSVWS